MESLTDALLRAAITRCQADIDDAKAKIALYTANPVGVGEHPDVVQEILAATEAGASAREKLEFLMKEVPRAQFLVKS